MQNKEKVAIISVLANIFLTIFKIVVGLLSNSIAILADGIHSGVDIFSSIISYIGIKIANKPEDEKHPYGHYKAEVLAGLIITILLFIAGSLIIYESSMQFLKKESVNISSLALITMIVSALINFLVAKLKINTGKKENSLSLLSDGVHSMVDVYSSLGIFVGLILAKFWPLADSILGIFIGIYIIKESIELAKEGLDSLLDASAGKEVEEKIKKLIKEEDIEVSSLKTQKRGSVISANIEIKLANNLTVDQVTQITEKLKQKLINNIENLRYVVIAVKSYDFSDNYYKSSYFSRPLTWHGHFPQGFGFGRRLKEKDYCVCPVCGYKVEHERGIPCATLTCPRCGNHLIREGISKEIKTKK